MQTAPPRRLAAVWFADIVGYTSLSSRSEAAALSVVSLLRDLAGEEVARRGGRLVKFIGDAALAEFPGAEAAVDAGLSLSTGFVERASELVRGGARLRVGVHLGEVTIGEDGDVYGDVVNVASRLQAEAEPGVTLVSNDVWRQLRRRPTFAFQPVGARSLKGLDEPIEVWAASYRYAPAVRGQGQGDGWMVPGAAGRKRLIALPFRLLRPDEDVAFLSFGIPDAVAVSLTGHRSILVRSTAGAPRQDGEEVDAASVARSAGVDLVLSGTVLRAGDRVRVNTQLADADGALIWADSATVDLGDLFELQDELVRRIVSSVAPASPYEPPATATADAPRSGEAYQLFLRANQVSLQTGDWSSGAELYRKALDLDPGFAPAWARLGRCLRLLGKYGGDAAVLDERFATAEEAFDRALELNPDLDLAHNLRAQHDVEAGRPIAGMIRLLRRARERPPSADLFVGLTHASRYCGLLEASVAAHERAVELEPSTVTSVAYTFLQLGDSARALEEARGDEFVRYYALHSLGRRDEAAESTRRLLDNLRLPIIHEFVRSMLAGLDGTSADELAAGRRAVSNFPDPEGRYFMARLWAASGIVEPSLELLSEVVEAGFACGEGLRRDAFFDSLRAEPSLGALLELADAQTAAAASAFRAEGGPAVLGLENE